MKHLRFFILLILFTSGVSKIYAADIGVDKIEAIDPNTIHVELSGNPALPIGELDAEVSILSDIAIQGTMKVPDAPKKIEISLEDAILPNTEYSLLTVQGADGSIDFKTPQVVEGFTFSGQNGIVSLEILDSKTLRIEYAQDIVGTSFEFKLLAESIVSKIEKLEENTSKIIIHVEPPLISEKKYILMIVDMQDITGTLLNFDSGIYDFSTPIFKKVETVVDTNISEENLNIAQSGSQDVLLNAAPDTSLVKEQSVAPTQLETVAQTITQTPETGAETWVILFATLIINTFIYLSRKKKSYSL